MELEETDFLARHAVEKGHRRANNTVKPKAFEPARDGSTSTFKITDLSHKEIIDIGEEYVAKPRGKLLLGWSKINVKSIIEEGLFPNPDNEPPRHVNIENWPDDKAKRLMIQTALADNAEFIPVEG